MSDDITKRLMDLSETMMEGMPYNDGDFTILDEACSEIESLREQLRVMTEEHRAACEDRDEIMRERDEARREVCKLACSDARQRFVRVDSKTLRQAEPQDFAAYRGWDYLKWPDQDALDRLAKLDEECGL